MTSLIADTDRHGVIGAAIVGHTEAIPTVKHLTVLSNKRGLH